MTIDENGDIICITILAFKVLEGLRMIKKYLKLLGMIFVLIVALIMDFIFKFDNEIFGRINNLLFSTITVIAGFWVTCYLLFLQVYKDRYPLKILQEKYLPQMKSNLTYILLALIVGCIVHIVDNTFIVNIIYILSSLFAIFIIMKSVYDTSKTIMLNTYIDEFCNEISLKLENKENSIKQSAVDEIKYVLDECIVKEEYDVVRNINAKMGKIFEKFLANSLRLIEDGENSKSIEVSFQRIIDIGIYELRLCREINSDLLIAEIVGQQVSNIDFCIEADQYEKYKNYINELTDLTYHGYSTENKKLISNCYSIYLSIVKRLLELERSEWILYLVKQLYSMSNSLSFVINDVNLKHFASLIVFALLNCKNEQIYKQLYDIFEKYTQLICKMSSGFSKIKIYYALYFEDIIRKKDKELLRQFLDIIIDDSIEYGNDIEWIEFKFYCLKEVYDIEDALDFEVRDYHIKLVVDIIEMKEIYTGYMFLPDFQRLLFVTDHSKEKIDIICEDIYFLLSKCIISNNISMFYFIIQKIEKCIINADAQKKEVQFAIFEIWVWLLQRTKTVDNKHFVEIIFKELEHILRELDKKDYISNDFGNKIIYDLCSLARDVDSDSYELVVRIIDMLHGFLKQSKELHFFNKFKDKKERLYRGVFNIAISCIENNFEEGLRRSSNALGWFTIYSIDNGTIKSTKYLLNLEKGMLQIAKEMKVSQKTQIFILTLFTTVGMYCCKRNVNKINKNHINEILYIIKDVDKDDINTSIKIRTYENDMWDSLFEKETEYVKNEFLKAYDNFHKKANKK